MDLGHCLSQIDVYLELIRDLPDPTTTLPLLFSYIAFTIRTSAFGAPIDLRVAVFSFLSEQYHMIFPDPQNANPFLIASLTSSRQVALVITSHQWSLVMC